MIETLRDNPREFDFFQALRRLECEHAHLPRPGEAHRIADEPVRFGQLPSLAFAPTTLSSVIAGKGGTPPRILVNFLGLLGPNGPLPLHVTEYIRDRELNEADPTLARFLDIFHHRVLALFYRAWAGSQQAVSHQRPDDDRFAMYIGSLFGAGLDSVRGRDAVSDVAKLHFAGRLACQTRHAEGLAAILGEYFDIPARLEQFVGQWLVLDPPRCLRLGESPATSTLGSTAIVGGRIWDRQQKFRLHLGPMDLDAYQRLLPGGDSLRRLVAWVRNYVGDECLFDVKLVLKRESVPRMQLGQLGQLGWSTWITSQPSPHTSSCDADDLVLSPCAA